MDLVGVTTSHDVLTAVVAHIMFLLSFIVVCLVIHIEI